MKNIWFNYETRDNSDNVEILPIITTYDSSGRLLSKKYRNIIKNNKLLSKFKKNISLSSPPQLTTQTYTQFGQLKIILCNTLWSSLKRRVSAIYENEQHFRSYFQTV